MSTFPWGLLLLVGAVVLVAWMWRTRKRAVPPAAYRPPTMEAGWGREPPSPTSQPAGGMGGNMMGGLATGLAVGAGVMAAQEIGRRMGGEHGQQRLGAGDEDRHSAGAASDSSLARDAGLGSVGGADTGASWDDAGGSYGGDGGDGGGGSDS